MMQYTKENTRVIWWICLGAMAILFLNALRSLPQIADLLISGDGDDLTRLQEVRDWLGGQSWFDTRQYRILPPEGISIHWSRYVDLGIAAFLVPASWVLPPTQAELAAIMLWPTLLGCFAILVIGHGANRLMGPAGAIGALVVFLTWSKLGGEFVVGRIDHHNMQILGATAVLYLSLVPGRRALLGALAGITTAFTLAIGLEMLPFLAVNWGVMVLRHAFDEKGVDTWLIAFSAAFTVAGPLFMVGQTPVSSWGIAYCDVLAPPVLALAAVGIMATLASVVLGKTFRHPLARILVAAVIAGAGLWLASPLLLPCLAGPYAEVAPEVRRIIETQVTEALPATALLHSRPELLLRVLLPPVVIAVFALGATVLMRGRISKTIGIALIQSFVVLGVGLVFALVQIRAANLMSPAVPVLAAFLGYAFVRIPRDHRLRAPAALLLLLAMPAVIEGASRAIAGPAALPKQDSTVDPVAAQDGTFTAAYCRNEAALHEIASLPKSIVFSSLNIGPAILVYTQHSATSAGYHRNTAAFSNGVIAFRSRNDLRDGLASSNADYLVVCVGAGEERVVTRLKGADWPDWLIEVTGDRKQIRAFQVDKSALAREIGKS
jgi:hypothetical protein